MRNLIILIFTISSYSFFGQTVDAEKNLQKYWKYRERLKNFVVVGDCQGCSIPAVKRQYASDKDPTIPQPWQGDVDNVPGGPEDGGELEFGDATIVWGHYLAFLATEYALMKKNGVTSHLYETKREIYYALQAINRLDITAEYWWRNFYKEDGSGAAQYDVDLNGFFIRDDVNQNSYEGNPGFGNIIVNGDLVENQLNSGLVPPLDGHKANYFASGFYEGTHETATSYTRACAPENGKHVGPREMSLDQVCQIMVGLAMVTKFVPLGENFVNTPFTGVTGNTDFSIEAKLIAQRINDWMQLNPRHWDIGNPVTTKCVNGVYWAQTLDYDPADPSHGPFDDCKCNPGGSNFELLCYGFARANSYIQTSYTGSLTAEFYYSIHYSADALVGISRAVAWDGFFQTGSPDAIKDVNKVFTLAAIGEPWDHTGANISHRLTPGHGDLWHLPLVNQVLFGNFPGIGPEYNCFLNIAPCNGPVYNDLNPIWSRNLGLVFSGFNSIYDPTPSPPAAVGREIYDGEDSGIDYLLYFNLYNLAYPGYCPSYRYISPYEIAPADIVKEGYSETDHKNFIAANTITAQMAATEVQLSQLGPNDNQAPTKLYIIQNDNDDQPFPLSVADVNFTAGKEVHLAPGFEVHAGANFHASIDPAIHAMDCTDPADLEACFSLISDHRSMTQNNDNNQTQEEMLNSMHEMANSGNTVTVARNVEYKVNISPNPNNGRFVISIISNKQISKSKIILYDIIGNIVTETEMSENITVDISGQTKGVYYVKIENDLGIKVEKIVYQ